MSHENPDSAQQRHELESQLDVALNDLANTRKRLVVAEMQLHDVATRLQAKLREIYGSTSWRVSTSWLRKGVAVKPSTGIGECPLVLNGAPKNPNTSE